MFGSCVAPWWGLWMDRDADTEKWMPVGENTTAYSVHRRSVLRIHVRQAGPDRKSAMNSFATDLDHPASDHPIQRFPALSCRRLPPPTACCTDPWRVCPLWRRACGLFNSGSLFHSLPSACYEISLRGGIWLESSPPCLVLLRVTIRDYSWSRMSACRLAWF